MRADSNPPCLRTAEFHAGGQLISECSAEGHHPHAGECIVQSV